MGLKGLLAIHATKSTCFQAPNNFKLAFTLNQRYFSFSKIATYKIKLFFPPLSVILVRDEAIKPLVTSASDLFLKQNMRFSKQRDVNFLNVDR